jgi:ubiquinone biosynthesis protein
MTPADRGTAFLSSLRQNLGLGGRALSGLLAGRARYLRALAVLAELGRLYGRHQWRPADAGISAVHRQAGEKLAALCRRNGATWIKAAQFFSCRPDVLPREYIEALQTLQNEARPVSFESLHPVLRASLGPDWRRCFMDIDPDPVATASIAQVHKARLPDGTPVAVKIRLPGVRRLFDQDARIFRLLARMTAPLVRELDLEQVTEQLLELTREELDFSNEADNLERFARLDHPERIRVPGLYRELSTDAVLVTGWVEGERLRDYLDGHPDEAADLLGVLFTSYLQQVTRFGLYQADPHPGNFIVGPDGSITILDFGAIGRLTPDEVKRYSRLLYGLMGFEGDVDIGELFVQAGFRGGDADTLRELAMYVLSDRMNRAALGESMTDLIEKFRENRVEIPDSYIGIARVLITVGGFLMNYDVPFDWRPPEQRLS